MPGVATKMKDEQTNIRRNGRSQHDFKIFQPKKHETIMQSISYMCFEAERNGKDEIYQHSRIGFDQRQHLFEG